MNNDLSVNILSDITVFTKYAKYIPKLKRRETWDEIVDRNKKMHIKKFPELKKEIAEAYEFVYAKKVLPSMRSMQFAGKPIEISPNRIYNCAFLPVNAWQAFPEIIFMLLGGSGLGISVQKHHIEALPHIQLPTERPRRYLISDSIEGWADAVKVLMKSYFFSGSTINFDFSDIREKGAPLITSGGKAPGPQPLKECLLKIRGILDQKENGDQLTSVEVFDIVCHIADAVLAGGIRRAAIITLFSATDDDMLAAKTGKWYELNPQRGRSNNSALLVRHKIDKEFFLDLWEKIKLSGSGEPGIFFTNDKEWGVNPCGEVSLKSNTVCNLTEINGGNVVDEQDLFDRAKAASFIGTLQATYTDFHYLRRVWQRNTEKEALIGVGITGIASGNVSDHNIEEAARLVKKENKRVAKILGINAAARTTTIKPSGTTSIIVGTSSGIHAWHSDFYIRRMRIGKNEALYSYLNKFHPELVKDEYFRPHDTAVIEVPQKAPLLGITRKESIFSLLNRIKKYNMEWVRGGHRKGDNYNNVSATLSVKPNEWELVGEWMWENRNNYNGLAVIPFSEDDHTHVQMPFEEIDETEFNIMSEKLKEIDITQIKENGDYTDLQGEAACAAGACEIT